MSYREKYICASRAKVRTRRRTPEYWISGPDVVEHDKYYAYLKHKAQAKFRGEYHDLTWEQWQELWPTDLFLKRGRGVDDLCLSQIDPELGWTRNNLEVITRRLQLQRSGKMRKDG